MPEYHAAFRLGERVQLADFTVLQAFHESMWFYHHPASTAQLAYFGQQCFVREIGYWHGGDCLYTLGHYVPDADQPPGTRHLSYHEEAIPGYWHEPCLRDFHIDSWHAQVPLARAVYEITAETRNEQPVVVVRTYNGIECLIKRHRRHEREAEDMRCVANLRNALSFERRYEFEGVYHDACRSYLATSSSAHRLLDSFPR